MKTRPRPTPPGVEWVVFKTLRVPVLDERGCPKYVWGERSPLTTEVVKRVGTVWADDKVQAETLARAYYGDDSEVQSAASAALTAEAESVVRAQRKPPAPPGRRTRTLAPAGAGEAP